MKRPTFYPAFVLVLLLCLLRGGVAVGQVFELPSYDYRRSVQDMVIQKVEITSRYTVIEAHYTNRSGKPLFVIPEMCIIDPLTQKKYYIIKTDGIPMEPERRTFRGVGDEIEVKLYFPRINIGKTPMFDVIEDVEQGIKFYNVYLKIMA